MADRSTIRGVIGHADYAGGSKGERRVAIIVTDAGATLVLRRIGANPYDPSDEWIDGTVIEATGYLHRDTFLVESYDVVAPPADGGVRGSPPPDPDG